MLDTIRGVIRAVVRGLAFWFALTSTGYLLYLEHDIPAWWVGFLMLMLKFYYDDLQNGHGEKPSI